jgi:hypothetical protein
MSSPFDQAAQSSASAAPTPADPSAGAQTDADQSQGSAQPGTYKAIIHVGTDGSCHVMVTLKGQVLCDEDAASLDEALEEITECVNGTEQNESAADEDTEAGDTGAEDQGEGASDSADIPDMSTMWQQEAKKRQGQTRSIVAPGSQV